MAELRVNNERRESALWEWVGCNIVIFHSHSPVSPGEMTRVFLRWSHSARHRHRHRSSPAMSLASRLVNVRVATFAPSRSRTAARRGAVAPLRAAGATIVASSKTKIAILGGTGFVGSRVVELLRTAGHDVFSVSKSGGGSGGVAIDLLGPDSADALKNALTGCDAVVSCVGVIGSDDDANRLGNGDANVVAVNAASAAGVKRFVYVSVASIVSEVVGGAGVLTGYFDGKKTADVAVTESFGEKNSLIVKPSFIYGGDTFGITPPRVTKQYGDILVKVLGSRLVKSIAAKMPGPIKLTLAEPISVEDVAKACAAGALGLNVSDQCDGTDEIKACAAKMV